MANRFKGKTNNGGSRGDNGRLLRRIYTQHGLTPPADLGTHNTDHDIEHRRDSRHPNGRKTQISSGVERWDPE